MTDPEPIAAHSGGQVDLKSRLVITAAFAAIIGGGLRIAASFIPYLEGSLANEAFYALIDLCLLFGIAAIYWSKSERLGWLGAVGYLVATAGIASLVGPDGRLAEVDFYIIGSAIFEIGLLILAIACLRNSALRTSSILWLVSAISAFSVPLGGGEVAIAVAGTALGLAYLAGGYETLQKSRQRERRCEPAMAFNQVTIGCNDLAEGIAFYQTLGFQLIVNSPANGYARFEAPNSTTLSLHQGHVVRAGAVLYFEHERLDSWVDQLTRQGIKFDSAPTDQSWGWREARLTDPSGNPLCLFRAGSYRRFPPWRVK